MNLNVPHIRRPSRAGPKLPHTAVVIRQKLLQTIQNYRQSCCEVGPGNEIFCPFAQLRILATYFTLKQLIKGRRPFGLLIFWFLREREERGLCSLESWQALPHCWSLNTDTKISTNTDRNTEENAHTNTDPDTITDTSIDTLISHKKSERICTLQSGQALLHCCCQMQKQI